MRDRCEGCPVFVVRRKIGIQNGEKERKKIDPFFNEGGHTRGTYRS